MTVLKKEYENPWMGLCEYAGRDNIMQIMSGDYDEAGLGDGLDTVDDF